MGYIIAITIIIIIGVIGTGFVIREVNQKFKQHDIDTDLQRSHEYETSYKSNWGRLSKIYLVAVIIMVLGLVMYWQFT